MAKISFNNGYTYYGEDDTDELRDGIEEVGWDVIAHMMNDDVREETHLSFEYDEGDELGFLVAYLKRADCDLTIG